MYNLGYTKMPVSNNKHHICILARKGVSFISSKSLSVTPNRSLVGHFLTKVFHKAGLGCQAKLKSRRFPVNQHEDRTFLSIQDVNHPDGWKESLDGLRAWLVQNSLLSIESSCLSWLRYFLLSISRHLLISSKRKRIYSDNSQIVGPITALSHGCSILVWRTYPMI